MAQATAISDAEFESLLASFNLKNIAVAVGVSGGGDSMALAGLVHRHFNTSSKNNAWFLVVDHRIRAESKAEASLTVRRLAEFGIPKSRIVILAPKTAPKATQLDARIVRFGLFSKWCRANNVADLMLAHHLEDQAETLLARLSRGSGLKGLASMEAVSYMEDFRVIRPLLGVPKARLVATLTKMKLAFVKDPSNESAKYLRSRIRKYLAKPLAKFLAKEGASPVRLAQTASHLARSLEVVENETARLSGKACNLTAKGEAIIELAAFIEAKEELALRLLADILCLVGGDTSNPKVRFDSLLRLYNLIKKPKTFKGQTLHNCKITIEDKQVKIDKLIENKN